jgi:hypothetical protein
MSHRPASRRFRKLAKLIPLQQPAARSGQKGTDRGGSVGATYAVANRTHMAIAGVHVIVPLNGRPAAIRRPYVVIIVAPLPLMFSGLPVSFGLFEVAADWSCVVDDVEAGNQPVLCQLSDVDDCG